MQQSLLVYVYGASEEHFYKFIYIYIFSSFGFIDRRVEDITGNRMFSVHGTPAVSTELNGTPEEHFK